MSMNYIDDNIWKTNKSNIDKLANPIIYVYVSSDAPRFLRELG